MDKSYIAENNAERERLKALIARLTDEHLMHPMPAGWTVAGVLAHMAFWDGCALYLIKKWQSGIVPSADDREPDTPEKVNVVNEAAKPLCLALPPRTAANLALQLAEETDQHVADMSDDLIAQVMAIGQPFDLARANHRSEHLDEIEQALSRS